MYVEQRAGEREKEKKSKQRVTGTTRQLNPPLPPFSPRFPVACPIFTSIEYQFCRSRRRGLPRVVLR